MSLLCTLFLLWNLIHPFQALTIHHGTTFSICRKDNFGIGITTLTIAKATKSSRLLLAKRSSESKAKDGDKKSVEKKGGLLSASRRRQLGVADDEEEYDLSVALDANTDPFITKLIAGSAILVILVLLLAAVVVPGLSDYGGEGVCVPILTGGRC
jgi:hypothetical protein